VGVTLGPHVQALRPGGGQFLLDLPPAVVAIVLLDQRRAQRHGVSEDLIASLGVLDRHSHKLVAYNVKTQPPHSNNLPSK
jgi:hypothetical protein